MSRAFWKKRSLRVRDSQQTRAAEFVMGPGFAQAYRSWAAPSEPRA